MRFRRRSASAAAATRWGGAALFAAFVLYAHAGVRSADAGADDPSALVPGTAVESELAVGGRVRRQLLLDRDTFVQIEVRELGPRTVLSLLDASGAVVARRETSAEQVTSYRLLAVIPAAGTYTLEVASYAQDGPGRHVLRMEPPRPATDRDQALASADAAQAEALRLANEGTTDSRQQALARLDAAALGFGAAEDARGLASVARDRALVLEALGDDGAAAAFEEARRLFQALRDPAGEAVAVNGAGRLRNRDGDRQAALALHERAAALAEAAGDRRALANYVINSGVVRDHSGWSEKAIESYERGLALATEAGSRRAEGRALNNLGVAYQNLGDHGKALQYFERALASQRAAASQRGEVITLGNISNIHEALGDYAQALSFFEQALPLARSAGLRDEEAWLLKNASKVHRGLGDHARAIDSARRALALWPDSAEREGRAEALAELGRSLHAAGDDQAAADALGQAVALASEISERFLEAEALLALAQVERDLGRLRDAVQHAERCIALTESVRGAMTNPDLRGSFQAAEEDKYGVLIDLRMRLHQQEPDKGHDAAALQVSEQARGRLLLDALIEARADIREGVDPGLLERERVLQVQLSDAAERLSAAGTGPSDARSDQRFEELTSEYGRVQARIRTHSPRYAALTQPVPATMEEIRRDVIDDQTVLLEFYLGKERSFLWAVTRSELLSQALPARAAIEAQARTVHALLTERQRSRIPAAVNEAEKRLDAESRQLAGILWGGIASRLSSDWKGRRLLVVASGALAYLPVGAFRSPGEPRPLVADHEVVYAPSASVVVALRRDPRPPAATTTVAVLADPVFERGDPRVAAHRPATRGPAPAATAASPPPPVGLTRALESSGGRFARLPFSRLEADAIAGLVGKPSLLKATGFEATRRLAAEGIGDRRIVHFATHGLLNAEHPDLSGLVLSLVDEDGTPQDGFLRMHEIYNLKLLADLVVLSACQTALGREIRGEGLIGLTRGFMYAGARAVVASLWQVDDESTSELMKRFYRGLLKDNRRPADALRAAQLEMSRDKRWSAPFYWAGFVLQGEWR